MTKKANVNKIVKEEDLEMKIQELIRERDSLKLLNQDLKIQIEVSQKK